MSKKRAESMATIDAVLVAHNKPEEEQPSPAALEESPIAPPPPPGSTYEYKQEESPDEKKIREAQEKLIGKEEADALRKQEAEEKKRRESISGVIGNIQEQAGSLVQGGTAKIAGLPTPGTIATPLILLIFFFFILIQFGGFSRLQWLWMVLTNNAYVVNAPGSVGTPSGGVGTGTQPGTGGEAPLGAMHFTPMANSLSGSGMLDIFA